MGLLTNHALHLLPNPQVYRDIPLPSWQVVYPDKLLQFRPLDLLRLDLFGVAGATAALAQAKYNSIVLQVCSGRYFTAVPSLCRYVRALV
jgi:hypothetical protein